MPDFSAGPDATAQNTRVGIEHISRSLSKTGKGLYLPDNW